ncbi:MAG: TAXI family TRAP transporter solute-binding subunit [Planctomycetaceae bacterium]
MRRAALVILLILLPLLVAWTYGLFTAFPDQLTIAGGPVGGRYERLAAELAEQIQSRLDIEVQVLATDGSYENMALLNDGQADLILYQHGVVDMFADRAEQDIAQNSETSEVEVAFVSNLHSEITHFLVHRDSAIESPLDLIGKRVAIGRERSGDSAISQLLLSHFGIDIREIDPFRFSYEEIEQGFAAGELDAAFITVGQGAPILRRLLSRKGNAADVHCQLRDIPYSQGIAAEYLSVSPIMIPAGLYRTRGVVEPARPIETVAVRSQLLARSDLPVRLIEEVTHIVLDESFQQQAGLSELFTGGISFARDEPEFTIHQGAMNVFEPGYKPLLNTDFVEATEGMRSFIVSMLIAAWLAFRWWSDRARRSAEHKLDRYIQKILEIERKQLDLDQTAGSDDAARLQNLLDEVTNLRQEALCAFTAHEINEDHAVETFITLCHALSDKINAKLTRQRIDSALRPLMPGQTKTDAD